jgi:hypothetical protein
MFIGGEDALVFFFAIFWGGLIGVYGRYRPFDTAALFSSKPCHAGFRLLTSLVVIDALPIFLFLSCTSTYSATLLIAYPELPI